MTIKAVVFDFGGVLADEGFRQGLKSVGTRTALGAEKFFQTARELIYSSGYLIGQVSEQEYWRVLVEQTGLTGDTDWRHLRQELLGRFVLKEVMFSAVDQLKEAGYTVAILSDQTNWLDELEERDRFFHHFHHVFNSWHMGISKREPEIFDLMCKRLNLTPTQVLFIDDSAGHVERARQRGLQVIHFVSVDSCLADLEKIIHFRFSFPSE